MPTLQVGLMVHYVDSLGGHRAAVITSIINSTTGEVLLREFSNEEIYDCVWAVWTADPATQNTWHAVH